MNNSKTVGEAKKLVCPDLTKAVPSKVSVGEWVLRPARATCIANACALWLWDEEEYRMSHFTKALLPEKYKTTNLYTRVRSEEPTGHCGLLNLPRGG